MKVDKDKLEKILENSSITVSDLQIIEGLDTAKVYIKGKDTSILGKPLNLGNIDCQFLVDSKGKIYYFLLKSWTEYENLGEVINEKGTQKDIDNKYRYYHMKNPILLLDFFNIPENINDACAQDEAESLLLVIDTFNKYFKNVSVEPKNRAEVICRIYDVYINKKKLFEVIQYDPDYENESENWRVSFKIDKNALYSKLGKTVDDALCKTMDETLENKKEIIYAINAYLQSKGE